MFQTDYENRITVVFFTFLYIFYLRVLLQT